MDYYDRIFYSLIGELEAGAAMEIVPNVFAPGGVCNEAYERLIEARNRVLVKLNREEDPDLEQMLAEMNTIQRTLCRSVMELRKL